MTVMVMMAVVILEGPWTLRGNLGLVWGMKCTSGVLHRRSPRSPQCSKRHTRDREPGSVYKVVDLLHRGIKDIRGIGEPLRVVRDEGELWPIDNRRLAAFKQRHDAARFLEDTLPQLSINESTVSDSHARITRFFVPRVSRTVAVSPPAVASRTRHCGALGRLSCGHLWALTRSPAARWSASLRRAHP